MSFLSSKKVVVTHNGSFHPDDVFAVASLSLLNKGKIKIVRTREESEIKRADYVVDVGVIYDPDKNFFDHHQIGGAGERENKVPYSSVGLIWKKYGKEICGSEHLAEKLDKKLFQFIDLIDNGVGECLPVFGDVFPFTIGDMVDNMNPKFSRDFDEKFCEAVLTAEKIIKDAIEFCKLEEKAEEMIEEAYRKSSDKRVLILEESYPWFEIVPKYREALFVIEPEFEADKKEVFWKVKSVRDNPNNFINRKDLPIEWAGKRDEELAKATGVADAVFCHNKRFMAVAKTKEGAIKLAELALE